MKTKNYLLVVVTLLVTLLVVMWQVDVFNDLSLYISIPFTVVAIFAIMYLTFVYLKCNLMLILKGMSKALFKYYEEGMKYIYNKLYLDIVVADIKVASLILSFNRAIGITVSENINEDFVKLSIEEAEKLFGDKFKHISDLTNGDIYCYKADYDTVIANRNKQEESSKDKNEPTVRKHSKPKVKKPSKKSVDEATKE